MSIKDMKPEEPGTDAPAGLGDDEIRQMKVDLQNCFPELEATITNLNGTDPEEDDGSGNTNTNPPNAATFSRLFERLQNIESGIFGSFYFQPGMVIMWSGAVSEVPAGWALCDGTQGTPDLRSRFIIGADSNSGTGIFKAGNKGGGAWASGGDNGRLTTAPDGSGTAEGTISFPDHEISIENLPEHSHKMFAAETNGGNNQPAEADKALCNIYDNSGNNQNYTMNAVDDVATKATLGVTSMSGSAGTPTPLTHEPQAIEVTGIVHTHEFTPNYYALALIQFIGDP